MSDIAEEFMDELFSVKLEDGFEKYVSVEDAISEKFNAEELKEAFVIKLQSAIDADRQARQEDYDCLYANLKVATKLLVQADKSRQALVDEAREIIAKPNCTVTEYLRDCGDFVEKIADSDKGDEDVK